jgi:hypothetical protein
MRVISISKLLEDHIGLTQAGFISPTKDHLPVSGPMGPQLFTNTSMASLSGDYLFEVQVGNLDPIEHTRLLLQYAADNDLSFETVRDDYLEMLQQLGYNPENFRHIIAGIMGMTSTVRTVYIPAVTPTYVFALVKKTMPNVEELFVRMTTDFVCHMLAPLGWIVPDAPYVYRMKRVSAFPRYSSLVDLVLAHDMSKVLESMSGANLSHIQGMLKGSMGKGGSVQPAMIAQHLASAVVTAFERSKGNYDAASVVTSVLTILGRLWTPNVPMALQPSIRIMKSSIVSEFRSNLALFLAYQDMVTRENIKPDVMYDPETMVNVILPTFHQAMNSLSRFKSRPLSDAISFMTKGSAFDHLGRPSHIAVYEEWDFSADVKAFVPVRQDVSGKVRYLSVQTATSTALSAAMSPVRAMLSLSKMADERLSAYKMIPTAERALMDDVEFFLGLPSLIEREMSSGLSMYDLSDSIMKGSLREDLYPQADTEVGCSPEKFKALLHDYYATMVHLVVAKMDQTFVTTAVEDGLVIERPYLVWDIRTEISKPLGQSAISNGMVKTSEPLEALAYAADFKATDALTVHQVDLEKYERSLHIWLWRPHSSKLNYSTSYTTEIRNIEHTVSVNEAEVLGLGRRRDNVMYLTPTVAKAAVITWLNWIVEEDIFLTERIASASGDLVKESFQGKKIRNSIHLINVLSSIGSSSAGANAARFAEQRLAESLYSTGNIDDYSELRVGIQKKKMAVWAGLVTLEVLGLTSKLDTNMLLEMITKNNSISLVIGSTEM